VLERGYRTADIGQDKSGAVGTAEMGDLIAHEVERSY
jgi:hypothetical protein